MNLCVCGHPSAEHVQFDAGEYCRGCEGGCESYRKAEGSNSPSAILSAGVTPEGLAGETVATALESVNEAAERLAGWATLTPDPNRFLEDFHQALAIERRHTVERAKERVRADPFFRGWTGRITAILDEVAS